MTHTIAGRDAPAARITMDDIPDIQGLILRGYNFHSIKYVVFNIQDVAGARAFCAALAPHGKGPLSITTAEPWPGMIKPEYCLNIGFTFSGLQTLIGPNNCEEVAKKSNPIFARFEQGAVADAGDVGDTDASDPKYWWYRNQLKSDGWLLPNPPSADNSELHIQVTLYTHSPQLREQYYAKLLAMIPAASGKPSIIAAFVKDSDPITDETGKENYVHFGYKDSLSQPLIDNPLWNSKPVKLLMGQSPIDDRPVVPIDQFVIRPDSPSYNAHPVLINGTFAAFRLLHQDVGAFDNFINSDPTTSPDLVAAKMCGRWFDGTPLVVGPDKPNPTLTGFDYTNFNYETPSTHQKGPRQSDDDGLMCPYAAHIRRTNPRDDSEVKFNVNLTTGAPLYAVDHRILRRASAYGPPYNKDDKGEVQRGLVGLFIGTSLTEQFQFLMSQWMNQGGFRGANDTPNSSGVDPLFGPQPSDWTIAPPAPYMANGNGVLQIPVPPGSQPVVNIKQIPEAGYTPQTGLSRFIRTDGGMYVFLPGIKGLATIANWPANG